MRALGFCVSVAHARYMARVFRGGGGAGPGGDGARPAGPIGTRPCGHSKAREVNVLFTVDLFNEGLDLPSVDTVLFLRPTESATVFLQQLGRGLRLAPTSRC